MTVKVGLTMIALTSIVCFNACDAVKDTLRGDASTIGEIRIDDIDGEALEAVIKDSLSDNEIMLENTNIEDVFIVCCQYIKRNTYNEDYVTFGGQILNNSNNRYIEVTHLLTIYDNDDEIIGLERIKFTEERWQWNFDLQPYQEYTYSTGIEADLSDVGKAVLTYANSIKAE
jgi:hypothetical protein